MSSVITLFLRVFRRIANCLCVLGKSLLNLGFKHSSLFKQRYYCCFWTSCQTQLVTCPMTHVMGVQPYNQKRHASNKGYITSSVISKCRVCRVSYICSICYQNICIFFHVILKCKVKIKFCLCCLFCLSLIAYGQLLPKISAVVRIFSSAIINHLKIVVKVKYLNTKHYPARSSPRTIPSSSLPFHLLSKMSSPL